jgi:hypothetical protein
LNEYTDSASRSGQRNFTGDDRALFLTNFGGLVITAYLEAMDYQSLRWLKHITSGKSDLFPIIGRKRDAAEHTPGDLIVGGKVEHDDKEITVDRMLFDSAFIPEIDELLNHIEVRGPYAQQIGQSLGVLTAKRIAIMHILASRDTDNGPGQPVPSYSWDANMRTSATAIETAAFAAKEYFMVNDMSGNAPELRLPAQQYLLCARNLGLQSTDVSRPEAGSGNRVTAKLGQIGGIDPVATNHIPKVNITTGLAKYQGDFTNTVGHISSKMAVGTLERKPITITMKEQAERLGTIIIGSKLDGHGKLRSECAYELATTVRA